MKLTPPGAQSASKPVAKEKILEFVVEIFL